MEVLRAEPLGRPDAADAAADLAAMVRALEAAGYRVIPPPAGDGDPHRAAAGRAPVDSLGGAFAFEYGAGI